MLAAMLESSEDPQGDRPSPTPPPEASRPPYLPFGAYALPSALAPPGGGPTRPTWTRAYELPTARNVVYAGLQLVFGANPSIRRASIYIGLLTLGAFGAAAVLGVVVIARLLRLAGGLETLVGDPAGFLNRHPELLGPIAALYFVAVLGGLLLIGISIEAQAIAISLLGAAAADRPMTLREALRRARQTFWRLFGSGVLVGIASAVISFAVALPFIRPSDSNQGITFIATMIATLAVTPFAYAAAGIVLGDAGTVEALRRSWRLFRARPRTALVVTLFTLVTAAIQSFALDSGLGLVQKVAELLHLGEGSSGLLVPAILALAVVMAFGSLTFTIAAIVAAPQVAAFLGLTFYSAGLDAARTPADGRGQAPRWVTVPMAVVVVSLGLVALITILSMGPAGT
jgi:hypothetical protein